MFGQLNKNIRKYFGISRTEANGILVLILLMMFLVILPLLYRQFGKGGYKNFEKDLLLMDSMAGYLLAPVRETLTEDLSGLPTVRTMKDFDPNEVSFDDMIAMGFDTVLTRRILSYRKRGGRFYQKDDLMKIYGFPDSLYDRILPYIRLKDPPSALKVSRNTDTQQDRAVFPYPAIVKAAKDSVLNFDLNRADTTLLSMIRGIGPVLSGRIIRYRELLGGYINTSQLEEVYGMKEEALENLKQAVFVDSLFEPSRIRINFSEWQDLVKHPYIPSPLANRILDTRSRSGPYFDGQDLTGRLSLPDSLSEKLIPYLQF
jgi:competence protein ComEA